MDFVSVVIISLGAVVLAALIRYGMKFRDILEAFEEIEVAKSL